MTIFNEIRQYKAQDGSNKALTLAKEIVLTGNNGLRIWFEILFAVLKICPQKKKKKKMRRHFAIFGLAVLENDISSHP